MHTCILGAKLLVLNFIFENKIKNMGQKVSRSDFEWTRQEEPHASRRKEILQKYPEIKSLFGPDRNMKWKVGILVLVQCLMLPVVQGMGWKMMLLSAYWFGGFINVALTLAMHEIAHNLAFGHSRPLANRMLGFIANLPIGLPLSVTFKRYHLEHHRYQGDEVIDTDLPTALEAKLFSTTFGKLVWVILQPFFYAFRPLAVLPKTPNRLEIINTAVQLSFNALVVTVFGWWPLLYLVASTILSMGLHPAAGHFISEHYMFQKGFETYSYYGPLNLFTWNVGYHNEHHDFPAVAGCNLPKVREIAREYYDDLPHHTSWTKVIYDFIFDPSIGPYARVKRENAEKLLKKQK